MARSLFPEIPQPKIYKLALHPLAKVARDLTLREYTQGVSSVVAHFSCFFALQQTTLTYSNRLFFDCIVSAYEDWIKDSICDISVNPPEYCRGRTPSPTTSPPSVVVSISESPSQPPSKEPSASPSTDVPTAWPSDFPTSPPTSFLDLCDTTINPSDPCDDFSGCFFRVDENEKQKCEWLRSRPELKPTLCTDGAQASLVCPETCGICVDTCEDDPSGRFKVNGISRDCFWLSLRPHFIEEVCADGSNAATVCVETCNKCIETGILSPTVSPISPPSDNVENATGGDSDLNDEDPDSFCFSGVTVVQTRHKGAVPMEELQVGDEVLVSTGNIMGQRYQYEPVYAFAHRNPSHKTQFRVLLPSKLEVTDNHLVAVKGRGFIPASMIDKGDVLSDGQQITHMTEITRTGIYAPFTKSGRLIVNGVEVSSYLSLGLNQTLMIGSVEMPLSFHSLSHTAVTPFRMYCRFVLSMGSSCQPRGDGYSPWCQEALRLFKVFQLQNPWFQGFLFVPLATTLVVFISVETVWLPAGTLVAALWLLQPRWTKRAPGKWYK